MQIEEEILEYVQTYCPDEYDLAGKATTSNIINAKLESKELEIVSSDKGSNFDIFEIIQLISLFVGIVRTVIEIIESLKKKKEKVTPEEVKEVLMDRLPDDEKQMIREKEEEIEQLIDEAIKKRNSGK